MPPVSRGTLRATGNHPWQMIAFFSMAVLYLFYYFCRYNIRAATPGIMADLHLEKWEFGIIATTFSLVYAGGQFLNGFLADRYGPKQIMIIGGLGSVAACFLFGASSGFAAFVAVWGLNAYFQSCGVAPGSRILYNWFPENRWASWFGVYNALCYSGGAIVTVVAGYAIAHSASGWRAAFFFPPICLLGMTALFLWLGKNKPQDVGLTPEWQPPSTAPARKVGAADYWHAFSHPQMIPCYVIAFGGKFIRWGILTWMVAVLAEPVTAQLVGKRGFGLPLAVATIVASMGDWGGASLSLVLGQVSDRFFKGSRWQTIALSFLLTALPLFWLAQGPAAFLIKKAQTPTTASAPASRAATAAATIPAAASTSAPASQPDASATTFSCVLLGVAIFLCGGLVQAVETPLFALPGDILGTDKGGTGVGIMDGWMYLGASLAGVALGWWLGRFGISGLNLLGFVALGCAGLAVLIRK